METEHGLLREVFQQLLRRPAAALFGDALIAGIVWILLSEVLNTYLDAKILGLATHVDRGYDQRDALHFYIVLGTVGTILARTSQVLAFGLLAIGLVKFQAEQNTNRRD